MNDARENEIDRLREDLAVAEEILGETEAQHASEIAHFGDSWPGAQLAIQRYRDHVAELRIQLKRYGAPCEAQATTARAEDDIPF